MRKTILGFSLGAVLFGTWAAHGAPSASMMYQLTLEKMNVLMGTTTINATTGLTTNNVSLGDLTYTQAGAANSSLSHIWSDGNAGNLTLGVPSGKTISATVNGTTVASVSSTTAVFSVYPSATVGGANYFSTGNSWNMGFPSANRHYVYGDFYTNHELLFNIGATTDKFRYSVNGTTIATLSAGTNTTLQTTPQIALANSTTVVLMPAAGRYGLLDVCDNKGNWGRFHLRGPQAPVLSTADACGPNNYLVSSAPSAYQVAVNVTSGNVVLMNGSDMACNITSIYRGF